MEKNELDVRKEKLISFFKDKKDWLQYAALIIILWIAYYIRSQNWNLLKDTTTGKYISLELDSTLFLRYAEYIVEHGRLYAVDMMRNFPLGAPLGIGTYTSYFVAYLYKLLHIFIPSITVPFADIIYPTIATLIGCVFLFLLVRRLFDYRVALLSVLFLATMPVFLFRSISSDHDILGLMFVFMTLYFFVAGWQSKKIKNNILFGFLAALTSILGFNTAGNIKIFFMIVAIFTILHVIMDSIKKSDFYVYFSWYIIVFGVLILTGKMGFGNLFYDYTILPTTIAFFSLLFYAAFNIKYLNEHHIYNKFLAKIPKGVFIFSFSTFLGLIVSTLFFSSSFIQSVASSIYHLFSTGLTYNRWASTVAENKRVFIIDWFTSFNPIIFWLFIAGLIIIIYRLVRNLKDHKKLFCVYTASILAFIFSRYSPDSILNASSTLSKLMFYGSVAVVLVYTAYYYMTNYYSYSKAGSKFSVDLDWRYTFILILALINVIGGTIAIRLFFELAPFVIIFASFTLIFILDYFLTLKSNVLKYGGVLLVVLLLFSPFSFAQGMITKDFKATVNMVKYSGPSYNQQWQIAGKWVRDNTPADAVFIHWWDYGYWVQQGFERATVTDGGNLFGWWNYLTARNVLTTPKDEDALKFLYAHNVSYLLIVSDEIGKYSAFSSIGSDKDYDRYSYLTFMGLNPSLSKETRNGTLLVYSGGYPLDEDFVSKGVVYPKGTPVIGVLLNVDNLFDINGTNTGNSLRQPIMILAHNGNQIQFTMKCIYLSKAYYFDNYDYGGCLRIIPNVQGNQVGQVGAATFMSRRVTDSLFGRLYLLEHNSDYFKLVYNDAANVPLAMYNGRSIGPTKIWKVEYPKDINLNETEYDYYMRTSYPDGSLV